MSGEEFRALYEQYFYYFIAAGIAIGLVLGSVPLLFGIRRGKRNLGILGLVMSAVTGAFSPLVAIIVAIVFTILIVRKPSGGSTDPA